MEKIEFINPKINIIELAESIITVSGEDPKKGKYNTDDEDF